MHRGYAAKNNSIANFNMSAKRNIVGKNAFASNQAIMGDMAVGHEIIFITNARWQFHFRAVNAH